MAYMTDGYYSDVAARAIPAERAAFIQRTYAHLAGAVLTFAGIEAALINGGLGEPLLRGLFGFGSLGGLALMIAFIASGYVARWWAYNSTSRAMQYAGLALYVGMEALIFLPLLYFAANYAQDQYTIQKAGVVTLGLFAGLTMTVFITGKDFSFLGSFLCVAGWVAFAVLLAGWIFGFQMGLWFSGLMVVLAGGYIVYDTSNVLHRYRTDQHVAASLELFASLALMFWYVLRIFLELSNRRN